MAGTHFYENINVKVQSGDFHHGWQIGITGQFAKNSWILCPEFNYYRTPMTATESLKQFYKKETYFHVSQLSATLQNQLLKFNKLGIRAGSGLSANYFIYVEENDLGINYDTVSDLFASFHLILGLDISNIRLNMRFEYGLNSIYKTFDTHFRGLVLGAGFFFR